MFAPEEASLAPVAPEIDAFIRSWDGATPYALVTVVHASGMTAAKPGARAIATADGRLVGFVGGGCVRGALTRAAREAIAEGRPRLIHVRPADEAGPPIGEVHVSHCPSRGEIGLFIEPVTPKPPLVVVGESALAQWVMQFGAAIRLETMTVGAAALADLAARRSLEAGFIVVATQGQGDRAALRAALESGCPAVFFVASRRKAAHLRGALEQDGVAAEALARLRSPAGLDLGAQEPAEIAVSIIADIIQLRRRRRTDATPETARTDDEGQDQ